MTDFNSIDEILDFAIEKEQEAFDFYMRLAGKMESRPMRLVFEDFAAEEKKHKQILQAIKDEKLLLDDPPQPTYLKISDYSIYDETFDPNAIPSEKDLQKAYVMAMKKEKAAFKLYTRLAEQTTHEECRKLFSALAQEEAKHRLRIEIEYDDAFLADN